MFRVSKLAKVVTAGLQFYINRIDQLASNLHRIQVGGDDPG